MKTKLSVNVNKLATIRNSRGKNNPDVIAKSMQILKYGADGITVHPRPDERHIRRSDVYGIKKALDENGWSAKGVEFNIEGYPTDDFLKMVIETKAAQCTLVPDPPDAITSNAGWLVAKNEALLGVVVDQLSKGGVRASVFVDPQTTSQQDYATLKKIGVSHVELYTERYAETYGHADNAAALKSYVQAAEQARAAGLKLNAGHDLSLVNLKTFSKAIPWLAEVSIGHALICDALDLGLEETIRRYQACLS